MPKKNEKRQLKRDLPDKAVSVVFSMHGKEQDFLGMLNDKSSAGIGMAASEILPPKTMLDICIFKQQRGGHIDAEQFLGEVRWCRPAQFIDDIFLLGIKSHNEKPLKNL